MITNITYYKYEKVLFSGGLGSFILEPIHTRMYISKADIDGILSSAISRDLKVVRAQSQAYLSEVSLIGG